MDIKPWQVVVIVAAVLVLGFSVVRQMGKGKIDFPDSVLVVDVETGDMYRMSLGKRNGAYFPEKNPDSGKHTLMPVIKSESGEWVIAPHARPALQDIDGENKLVNESNWTVTIENEDVQGTLKAGG